MCSVPGVRSALDAVQEAYHNPAAISWGALQLPLAAGARRVWGVGPAGGTFGPGSPSCRGWMVALRAYGCSSATAGRRSPCGLGRGARTLRGASSGRPGCRAGPSTRRSMGVIQSGRAFRTLVVVMPEDTCRCSGRAGGGDASRSTSTAPTPTRPASSCCGSSTVAPPCSSTGTVPVITQAPMPSAPVHDRAVADGTELRLAAVVTADVVRRVLSLSGLDRLVAVYSDSRRITALSAASARCATGTADRGPRHT